jgi:cation:H+ antiporter
MEIVFLILGLVLLLISGNYIVKGGVTLASHLNVSTLVVGVIIISFGTSAPELVVSVQAALSAHPDISIGNIIGSNVSNIALILGVASLILPISVKSVTVKFDWPIMMLSCILFYVFALNLILERWEGLVFVLLMAGYIFYTFYKGRRDNLSIPKEELQKPGFSLLVSIIVIVAASAGLVLGAQWLIKGATSIARDLGVSERIISISLIAFGTSVPELATSAVAAFKKEMDISIGNIIGSNIFNVFSVLGIASIINDLPVNPMIIKFDVFIMIGISLLLFLFILPLKGGKLTRGKGGLLFITYIAYIYLLFTVKF